VIEAAKFSSFSTGDRLWIASTSNGNIYQVDFPQLQPLPTLSPWAWFVLVSALGCSALFLARR
jgi:hypothetical protein